MRLKKMKKILREREHLPCLITDLTDIRYLTGFSGSNAALIIGEKSSFFISDSRYEEYIKTLLSPGFSFFLQNEGLPAAISDCFSTYDTRYLFFPAEHLTFSFHTILRKTMKGVKLIPLDSDPVADIRIIKEDGEIEALREAARITDDCFDYLLEFVRPGMTEWEIALAIEVFYKQHRCRACSFDPIVASGAGSSMPHYIPSMSKTVGSGDVLLIDMGCLYEGYNSDLTRTFFIGSIDEGLADIYKIVYDAQLKAIESVRPGIDTVDLDSVARSYITDKGYGENFGHGLGHGLGMDIHEPPAVKKNMGTLLKKNMVITIEPGIYIPGRGGVRIEDMVLVTASGCEVLTQCSKELTVIRR